VLIDLPGLTNNVSYNGLWAARNVITPVEMGPFEAEQADALRKTSRRSPRTSTSALIWRWFSPNKVDTRTKLAEEYLAKFADEYPDAIAPAYVPYSQDIRNAAENGRTAFQLEEPSSTAAEAIDAYVAAAETLQERLGGN